MEQLLSRYNQSYASIVAISTNIVSSHTQLTTFVANRVSQQVTAVNQLSTLRNETVAYLATAQTLASQANSLKSTATLHVSQSIYTASIAANDSMSYQSAVNALVSSLTSIRNAGMATQRQGTEVYALAVQMRDNASSVFNYAAQLQGNITAALPDYSQVS